MLTPTSLLRTLAHDFNQYTFRQGDTFMWSSSTSTIYHAPITAWQNIWSLLHEIAHAELNHTTYRLDVDLVNYEMRAWEYASAHLAPQYKLQIDNNYIQDHIDTYREWLHSRSTCPECGQNGIQTQNTYRCINCRCLWRANDARLCALRRIKL